MNQLFKIIEPSNAPFITTLFDSPSGDKESNQNYREVILRLLKKILPRPFFEELASEEETRRHQALVLKEAVPIISHTIIASIPGTLSFFFLSQFRASSFKFFFEMISRWLTPGRRLNVVLVYAADFQLTRLNDETYTICEVMIEVTNQLELEEIQRNFPLIESEISLGISSAFYAQRILEIKGLTADDKIALIHEFISLLIKRFPEVYDQHVFAEMQHVLVTCRDEFKANRQARHLGRIISIQYLFRNSLKRSMKEASPRRHVNIKIFRAMIKTATGPKQVLSIIAGVNLLRDQKAFGEKHLLKAVQHLLPFVKSVEDSFFIHRLGSENICLSYLEVEKKEGGQFSSAEIQKLRKELSLCLKNRIEHRLYPLFTHRNEEEVMRNILILTDQIRYLRDIPQVLINFDEQVHAHLYFNIILARVLKPESVSIADLFKEAETVIEYFHDRKKMIGYVRKKYPKEATVFRLKLPRESFLRSDQSIDLYKARQFVVHELSKVVGEFRDYNGGMISKQHEMLSTIRLLLNEVGEYDDLLLEDFFYSLTPVVARALLDPIAFKILFLMLLEGIKDYNHQGTYMKFHQESLGAFVMVITDELAIKDRLFGVVGALHISSTELVFAQVRSHGSFCVGYICTGHSQDKKDSLFEAVRGL